MGQKILHTISDHFAAQKFLMPVLNHINNSDRSIYLLTDQKSDYYNIDISMNVNFFIKTLPIMISLNPLESLRRIWRLYWFIRKNRFSILHTHMTKVSLIPLIAAFLARVPIRIYQNHGMPFLGYRRLTYLLLLWLEKVLVLLSTHTLCVSKSNRQAALDAGVTKKSTKIRVLNFGSAVGVDELKYSDLLINAQCNIQNKLKLGLNESTVVVGYIGRPLARKGFHFLLDAWKALNYHKNLVLLIAGCSESDCIPNIGNDLKNIKALGFIENLDVYNSACDIIVLPSYHEGLPISLIEGGAAGCPLIGTNIPGIRDTIENGLNGFLVPLDDKNAFIESIELLTENKELRLSMGKASRTKMLREFSQSRLLKSYEDFYAEIISEKK